MPGSAAKVLITERQQEVLQELVAGRTTPVRLAQLGAACDVVSPGGASPPGGIYDDIGVFQTLSRSLTTFPCRIAHGRSPRRAPSQLG